MCSSKIEFVWKNVVGINCITRPFQKRNFMSLKKVYQYIYKFTLKILVALNIQYDKDTKIYIRTCIHDVVFLDTFSIIINLFFQNAQGRKKCKKIEMTCLFNSIEKRGKYKINPLIQTSFGMLKSDAINLYYVKKRQQNKHPYGTKVAKKMVELASVQTW